MPAPAASPFPAGLRVALVHDWLTGMRGGEKCLEVFCEIFPDADIYTLLYLPGRLSPIIERRVIVTSLLQRLPRAARTYRWALPFFPAAIESFDFAGYDLILSSSHCVAKSARTPPGVLSVCYCHTPMRYVWDRFDDYFGGKPLYLRWPIRLVANRLRRWDAHTAGRVHLWLANSTVVRQRIQRYYGVPARSIDTIHPPVDTTRFATNRPWPPPSGLSSRSYELVVSALVPYKRIDLAVRAAKRAGRHLVVVGDGPEAARLQRWAVQAPGTGSVSFRGAVTDDELPGYYSHCRSFVFPGLEDFGITPLEATACGRPVVAFGAGGALDTVREGINGIFFDAQTVESLARALADPRLDGPWHAATMKNHAEGFSRERFRRQVSERLATAWQRHLRGESHV
jgi:glycosyltransferase involved in cell wall biosynthesis